MTDDLDLIYNLRGEAPLSTDECTKLSQLLWVCDHTYSPLNYYYIYAPHAENFYRWVINPGLHSTDNVTNNLIKAFRVSKKEKILFTEYLELIETIYLLTQSKGALRHDHRLINEIKYQGGNKFKDGLKNAIIKDFYDIRQKLNDKKTNFENLAKPTAKEFAFFANNGCCLDMPDKSDKNKLECLKCRTTEKWHQYLNSVHITCKYLYQLQNVAADDFYNQNHWANIYSLSLIGLSQICGNGYIELIKNEYGFIALNYPDNLWDIHWQWIYPKFLGNKFEDKQAQELFKSWLTCRAEIAWGKYLRLNRPSVGEIILYDNLHFKSSWGFLTDENFEKFIRAKETELNNIKDKILKLEVK